ncbi:hypothetical protein [Streptomyces sp. NPDC002402]
MTATDKRQRNWLPLWFPIVTVWSAGHVIWDTGVWRRVVYGAWLACVIAAAAVYTVRFVQKRIVGSRHQHRQTATGHGDPRSAGSQAPDMGADRSL